MIELENLSFSYGSREVLRGVSLRVEPGELVFLLGANGSGKTTLFRCMLGLLPGYRGRIRLDGAEASALSPRALAGKLAYVPQATRLVFPYTALELVLMGAARALPPLASPGKKERAAALAALEELGIAALADRPFPELSGGEQQMVLTARALAQGAGALLMDEPTSALDFGNQVRVLEQAAALANRGRAVLLSCHNPQHAMLYARRVVALHEGRVAADGPPEAVLDEALVRKLYGVPARFVATEGGTLIAPASRSVSLWTADKMRFLADAARVNGCYEAIASALAPHLPENGRVCDAGCGIGCLSLALAPRCREVVAADLSAAALAHLRAAGPPPNVTLRRCDLWADQPERPYDAMVFCFFGSPDEILAAARRQCAGAVAVVKRLGSGHRFSRGDTGRPGFGGLCRALEARGIPYGRTVLTLDLGQPFRSLADAVLFFRTHSRDDPAELTQAAVERRLVRRDDPEFPWYFPVSQEVGLAWFQAGDIPPEGADTLTEKER